MYRIALPFYSLHMTKSVQWNTIGVWSLLGRTRRTNEGIVQLNLGVVRIVSWTGVKRKRGKGKKRKTNITL